MPLYKADKKTLTRVERTTFKRQGWVERRIQNHLKSNIGVIAPDAITVAEEFNHWSDSRRRIDLLCVDKGANLVVIELKREDGGNMELQAIRYAAMIADMTFDQLVLIYQDYLDKNKRRQDAAVELRKFLGRNEPGKSHLGKVKIILVAADFSKELKTSVMWLNRFGLDIKCVSISTYKDHKQLYFDIQTVIPLPKAADHQIQVQEKKQNERESKKSARDYPKYEVRISGQKLPRLLNKRQMMFQLIKAALNSGGTPEQLMEAIPKGNRLFRVYEGELNSEEVKSALLSTSKQGASVPNTKRYHCEEGELFHSKGSTYALTNQWWGNMADEAANTLSKKFPALKIKIKR